MADAPSPSATARTCATCADWNAAGACSATGTPATPTDSCEGWRASPSSAPPAETSEAALEKCMAVLRWHLSVFQRKDEPMMLVALEAGEAALGRRERLVPPAPVSAPPATPLPCGCVPCVCKDEERCHGCGGREASACQESRLAGGPRHAAPAPGETPAAPATPARDPFAWMKAPAPPAPTPGSFFDKRAADALAREVQGLIDLGILDSRSRAADALLDYVDPGPNESVPGKLAAPPPGETDRDAEFERLLDVLVASVELDGFHGDEEDEPAACRAAVLSAWSALRDDVASHRGAMDLLGAGLDRERARAEAAELDRDEARAERDRYRTAWQRAETAINDVRREATEDRNRLADSRDESRAALSRARGALEVAEATIVRAREALNHDRSGLAAALNRIQSELRGRYWMRHEKDGGDAGSWGSYPYTQHTTDTLRREISWAFGAMATWAEKALNASGNLAGAEIRAMEEPLGVVRRALAQETPVDPSRQGVKTDVGRRR